ncbi:MAG: BrnA antitoxin family protein [Methylocystis sp.]|nr:BrnA antitoxin family protein [Methylocystis sp.]
MTKTKQFESGHGYAKEDWDAVSDNPPLTDAELAAARPFAEVLPKLAAAIKRTRGPQKAPIKEQITLRLDRAAVAAFRATGHGWQSRIDDVVKKAAAKLRHKG